MNDNEEAELFRQPVKITIPFAMAVYNQARSDNQPVPFNDVIRLYDWYLRKIAQGDEFQLRVDGNPVPVDFNEEVPDDDVSDYSVIEKGDVLLTPAAYLLFMEIKRRSGFDDDEAFFRDALKKVNWLRRHCSLMGHEVLHVSKTDEPGISPSRS